MCKKICQHPECDNQLSGNQKKYCSQKCANNRKRPWRKKGKNIDCPVCGAKFYAPKYKLKSENDCYCSVKCGQIGSAKRLERKIIRTCNGCGEKYETVPSRNKDYCSEKCFHGDKKGVNKKCLNCDNDFYSYPSEKDRKFCSVDCHDEYRREVRVCDNCGKEFNVRRSDPFRYCSRECFESDSKLYPKTSYLRDRVRIRQGIRALDDRYIKGLIRSSSGLSAEHQPKELIELKRLNIKRKRIIKKRKTHGNSQ